MSVRVQGVTWNGTLLESVLLGVTTVTGPVDAKNGTQVLISVSEMTVNAAGSPAQSLQAMCAMSSQQRRETSVELACMSWYWPDIDTPQRAKLARVNAVGLSIVFGVLLLGAALPSFARFHSWTRRDWISAIFAVAFFGIAAGIYKMSRSASVTGLVWWCRYCIVQLPGLIVHSLHHDFGVIIWIVLDVLFLTFYISAVRAAFAYHRQTTSLKPL
jgi:hypothetical protein